MKDPAVLDYLKQNPWMLQDASASMKAFINKKFPDQYEEKIATYMTPIKIVVQDQFIYIISLTDQLWGGVVRFPDKVVQIFTKESGIMMIRDPEEGEPVLTYEDYVFSETAACVLHATDKITITGKEDTLDSQAFYEAMVQTGLVTKEELERYGNKEQWKDLPLIKTVSL